MQDAITQALVAKLDPLLYTIGLLVVIGIVTFGSTLISLIWRSKESQSQKLQEQIEALRQVSEQNSLSLARLEGKLEIFIQQTNKDLNGIGNKLRISSGAGTDHP